MPLSDKDKRTLRLGGIVVGVLLLGFLLFNVVLGGGGEDPIDVAIPTDTPTAAPTVEPTVSPTVMPSPVTAFTGRDPFSVPPALGTPAPTDGSTPPPTDGSTPPPTGPTPPPTGPTPPPTTPPPPPPPGNGSGTNQDGDSIVLLDVFVINGVDTVQVEVNGQIYNVSEGQTFHNGRYRLRSASGNCATFVRGDESFTLCVRPNK